MLVDIGDGVVVTVVLSDDPCNHIFRYVNRDKREGVKSYH